MPIRIEQIDHILKLLWRIVLSQIFHHSTQVMRRDDSSAWGDTYLGQGIRPCNWNQWKQSTLQPFNHGGRRVIKRKNNTSLDTCNSWSIFVQWPEGLFVLLYFFFRKIVNCHEKAGQIGLSLDLQWHWCHWCCEWEHGPPNGYKPSFWLFQDLQNWRRLSKKIASKCGFQGRQGNLEV